MATPVFAVEGAVSDRPVGQSPHGFREREPKRRQGVLHPRCGAGVHVAYDYAVSLERLQRPGQHLLRDASQLAL